jgi:lipoprotein-anchoring transpeptidase ErfK/SrfK
MLSRTSLAFPPIPDANRPRPRLPPSLLSPKPTKQKIRKIEIRKRTDHRPNVRPRAGCGIPKKKRRRPIPPKKRSRTTILFRQHPYRHHETDAPIQGSKTPSNRIAGDQGALPAEVSATSQAFRPIHPQIPLSKFAPKKASNKLLRETIGAVPGASKIKIDATTIVLESTDSTTISPQATDEKANGATTTDLEVSDGATPPAKTPPAKPIAAKPIAAKTIAAIPIGPRAIAAITIAPQTSDVISNDATPTVR